MSTPLKVGIVGARSIGKHHAKWFAKAGCEVTAVYGRSEASAEAAAVALRELFGFSGRAFHDWKRFRAEGNFDACSVCSPAEGHLENVRDLAADGKHLLCEKPLVWHWDREPRELLEDAADLVDAADRAGVILAMNAQYPAVLEGWDALHRQALGRDPEYQSLYFRMETKGKPRSPHGAAEVWVDLAPHPLAVLDTLAPGGIDWSTLRHEDGPHEALVRFDWVAKDFRLPATLECRRSQDGTACRRIANQDLTADYEGCNVDGEFRARLRSGDHEWIGSDFMQVSVQRFVEAVRTGDPSRVLVDGTAALRQQMALTGVWAHCWGEC